MSILQSQVVIYGSAEMPDDDTPQNVGGAIDTSIRVAFEDIAPSGNVHVVSSAAGDTTQTVTVSGRNPAGELKSEGKVLTGLTPVAMTVTTTWERLLKAIKSATTTGDVAVEAVTPTRDNTAQGGAAETASAMAYITLDASASAVDDEYNGAVLRIDAATGIGQIRRIIDYDGTTKRAYVNLDWGTVPDATSGFLVSDGMVFEKSPTEIMEVRRPFYNAAAEPAGGSNKKYYEKVFFKNIHATLSLTTAQILEQADPSALMAFDLESSLDGSDDNGANNRQVAPGGYTFDSTAKNVVNSQNHTAGAAQGCWLELTLDAGEAAAKTSLTLRESGQST